jgi:hypothetical protein
MRSSCLGCDNIAPNANSETSIFKIKGLERSTISINSGVVIKEAFEDWKALTSTPHEKG